MASYNSLWTFGDSYTHCWGLEETTVSNVPWGDKYKDNIWPRLLAKELNIELTNKGNSGSANDNIVHEIIKHLAYLKKDDLVIIGATNAPRMLYVHTEDNSKYDVRTISSFTFEDEDGFFCKHYSKSDREIIHNYFLHLYPDRANAILNYNHFNFRCLQSHLNQIGIKTLVWTDSIWNKYQQIDEWTDRKYIDGHWSPNGCMDFTSFLLWALDNEKFWLTDKEVDEAGRDIYRREESYISIEL